MFVIYQMEEGEENLVAVDAFEKVTEAVKRSHELAAYTGKVYIITEERQIYTTERLCDIVLNKKAPKFPREPF